MSHSETILAQHPYIGIFSGVLGFVTPFIPTIIPILQVIVLLLSIWVTVLTIEAKLKERKHKRRKHD